MQSVSPTAPDGFSTSATDPVACKLVAECLLFRANYVLPVVFAGIDAMQRQHLAALKVGNTATSGNAIWLIKFCPPVRIIEKRLRGVELTRVGSDRTFARMVPDILHKLLENKVPIEVNTFHNTSGTAALFKGN